MRAGSRWRVVLLGVERHGKGYVSERCVQRHPGRSRGGAHLHRLQYGRLAHLRPHLRRRGVLLDRAGLEQGSRSGTGRTGVRRNQLWWIAHLRADCRWLGVLLGG